MNLNLTDRDHVLEAPSSRPAPSGRAPRSGQFWVTSGLVISLIVVGGLWALDRTNLFNRVNDLSTQLSSANANLDEAKRLAAKPTLSIDNTPQTISATGWLTGGVPDTFTYHLAYTSDVSLEYAFLTFSDYTKFATCDVSRMVMNDPSVNKLGGCLYRLGGVYAQATVAGQDVWGLGTSVSVDFHGAEGCAGWVRILFPLKAGQTAHVTPNISVTYNPSPVVTAPC